MYIADYHIHTNFSGDSKAAINDIIKTGIKKGLKEIAITDHIDFEYPSNDIEFKLDIDNYINTINKLKEKFYGDIKILLGVEVGLQPHVSKKNMKLVKGHSFDFVIGSVHVGDSLDFYNGDFFKGKTKKQAYLRYFENIIENIEKFNNYDVLGHLDYIIRYGGYEDKELSYSDYLDIIDTILKLIIKNDSGVEINTSGYRYGLNQTHPKYEILKRYKELGGKIVTVGSDSHTPRDITADFNKAYELLEKVGFDSITLFDKRKPRFEKIK
ncbi:MAG: histidinol-phosphatase HisJ family protein [Firmicutes bacterium]|nr:histidinol-phosphatase HisJ family protein [Bacillota bacterium]